MNSIDASAAQLLDWVDFKWLMAGDGCVVDLDRLCTDASYASSCVDRALDSAQPILRRLAQRIRSRAQAAG